MNLSEHRIPCLSGHAVRKGRLDAWFEGDLVPTGGQNVTNPLASQDRLFSQVCQVEDRAMYAGTCKAAAYRRNGTYKAGAHTAQQVCPNQNLGKVPVNPEPKLPDDRQ